MSQLDLGDVWSDELTRCSCGGALLVYDRRVTEGVVRVTRCKACGSEVRGVVRVWEADSVRSARLREEVRG